MLPDTRAAPGTPGTIIPVAIIPVTIIPVTIMVRAGFGMSLSLME